MSLKPSISSPEKQKPVRDSNIELLRILVMCGVVLLHYNGYIGNALSRVTPGTVNQGILLGLEGFFICAVNLFVLITGYFSCTTQRRSAAKVFGLILQVMVFNAGVYLLKALPSHTFSSRALLYSMIPKNYFVILYAVLYLVSPYLNLLLQSLSRKQMDKLLVLSLALFSVWPILTDLMALFLGSSMDGLNSVSAYGDDSGYTIVNFALMYMVGAYLRLANIQIKKRYSAAAVAVLTAVLGLAGTFNSNGILWSYCNPLVIAQAVAVFLLFRGITLRSRLINELAKGAFTCYLLHPVLLAYFQVAKAVQSSPLYLITHILCCCGSIYLASWLIYKVYDLCSRPLIKLADKLFAKCKLDFSL